MSAWQPRLRRLEELQEFEQEQWQMQHRALQDQHRTLQDQHRAMQDRLDALQARMDAITSQFTVITADHANLMKSLPVTLRDTARELESLRARLDAAGGHVPGSAAQ